MTQVQTQQVSNTLSYGESWTQWWRAPNSEKAEGEILSWTPFYPESDGKRVAKSVQTDIGDNLHINGFEIVNTQANHQNDTDMVVLHGYGAGLGFFFQNFDSWSSIPGSRVFALDLLGFGRSSRPKFEIKTSDTGRRNSDGSFPAVIETEEWFIDSIEKWRAKKGLESFTLMGHSMGGYIAAAYALQHPERVKKLILVSPAGVERGYKPELEHQSLINTRKKNVSGPQIENELIESQAEILHDDLTNELSTTTRELPGYFSYLWNRHISPFSILRSSGFFAPKLVSRWTNRRFGEFPSSMRNALHTYAYRIFTSKPSGEYALTRILAPGAVPRMPMISRLPGKLKCPSTWIYGDHDWMNVHAGEETVARLHNDGVRAEFHIVPQAGHHVYLDNPSTFNKIVDEFLKE